MLLHTEKDPNLSNLQLPAADKKMAQKFMDDLKKDGYKVMMTQKKIKGVDEGSQDEGFASDAQKRSKSAFASG